MGKKIRWMDADEEKNADEEEREREERERESLIWPPCAPRGGISDYVTLMLIIVASIGYLQSHQRLSDRSTFR
jgi:hypothetical protein